MTIKHRTLRSSPGFTLVEIVVVVPFLIIIATSFIAFLATTIVNLGVEGAKTELQAKAQTAVNAISDDLFRTEGFWLTPNGVSDTNKSGGWNAVSDNALIVSELAYDKDRFQDSRQYVYKNSPGSCSTDAKYDNPIATNTLVYFVQNGVLYERVLVPSQAGNCDSTYRKTSCPEASASSTCPADRKLATEVQSIAFEYYLPGSSTPLTTAGMTAANMKKADRAKVVLKLLRTIDGQEITATSTLMLNEYNAANSAYSNITLHGEGYRHTCRIKDSKVYCWGYNNQGQLGNNTYTNSLTPVAVYTGGVLNGRKVTDLTTGTYHNCVLADGEPFCWGNNDYGQLGDGTTTETSKPVAVNTSGVLNGKKISDIRAFGYHTCVLADGAPYCWGQNTYGQLGNNSTTNSLVPVATYTGGTLSGKSISMIRLGYSHTCVLADGVPQCWGYNNYGQLGNNSTTNSSVPVTVYTAGELNGRTITQLASSSYTNCVVADGAPYCWGHNSYGQLGNNSTTHSYVPTAVYTGGALSGKAITTLDKGWYQLCVMADGAPYCWGQNTYGQLGNNSTTNSLVPVAVYTGGALSGKVPTSISGSSGHTCALAADELYCWGLNDYGQLGDGSTTNSSVPVLTLQP